jgi:hypothetical protein
MKNKIAIVIAFLAVMFAMIGMAAAIAVPAANISGMKFNDLNANGIKDPGESGLANWTITLTAPGQEFPINTLTDGNGNYVFSGLAAGNYTVGEVLKTGWMQTAPGGTYNVSLNGIDATGKDFGNFNISQPIVGNPVTPTVLNVDLRTLPVGRAWQEGDPVGERSEREITSRISSGASLKQSRTGVNKGEAIQRQDLPSSAQVSDDPLSKPFLNFDGIPFTGAFPPDTIGDVGPNHYIQAVNFQPPSPGKWDAKFAIFDKSGKVLVGLNETGALVGVNMSQLWINASKSDTACGNNINTSGDPIVQYDHLADRWLLGQLGDSHHNYDWNIDTFCIAVSRTSDPISGGWFLYEFPIPKAVEMNDYPKLGVWPDAYYVGTNAGYPAAPGLPDNGGDAWAFDRENMLNGTDAGWIRFHTKEFMLPSDLDGPAPPAGAPNVFVRFVEGAEFGGSDRLEMGEFHVDKKDFGVVPMGKIGSKFTLLPDLDTDPFDSSFCGEVNALIVPCIPQPMTSWKLAIDRPWTMYRLQYRNFGDYETLITNHGVDINGKDLAGVKWYELRNEGLGWYIFQEGTYSPDATSRWMGSIAMDVGGNIALGYSVSNNTVFPGIRYTGRSRSQPPGEMPEGEFTIVDGGGSQIGTSRWGDYSAMSVDPVDDCTFWFTSEYYPTTPSPAQWHTRIANFSFFSSRPGFIFCKHPSPPVIEPVPATSTAGIIILSGMLMVTAILVLMRKTK